MRLKIIQDLRKRIEARIENVAVLLRGPFHVDLVQ